MARSLGSYIRGSTKSFYEWLFHPAAPVPRGPPVWICGDCHVGNFGPIAAPDDEIRIEIRDFDQATIGNPAHDLIRLGLSLAADAAASDLSGITTAEMLEHLLKAYAAGLTKRQRPKLGGPRHDPKSLRKVVRIASNRSWKTLRKERIDGSQRTIPLGKRFWPISRAERDEIARIAASEEMNALVTCLRGRDTGAKLVLLDAAYWVKGCSSLGRLRYAVLLAVKEKGKPNDYCLIDIKQAVQSDAPAAGRQRLATNAAERVVEGARRLSPAIGERMRPAQILGRRVFMRELRPQDLKPQIPRLSPHEVLALAGYLAEVLAHAHGAQMDLATRRAWKRKVLSNASGRRNVSRKGPPSWLWANIVELMATHERSYLEHCGHLRRAALGAMRL